MAVLVRQGTDPRFRQQAPRSALPAPGAETDSDVWEGENAVRTAGVALVLVLVGWVVGCEQVYTDSGDDAGGETGAEGAWEGGFSTQTQTVGYLGVQIDAEGRVTGGMGWIQGVESSNVKVGTLRTFPERWQLPIRERDIQRRPHRDERIGHVPRAGRHYTDRLLQPEPAGSAVAAAEHAPPPGLAPCTGEVSARP